jgi:hypothetical protein
MKDLEGARDDFCTKAERKKMGPRRARLRREMEGVGVRLTAAVGQCE